MDQNADVRPKKPIIGLCGGIGAGKSLVAAELQNLGCVVADSDRLAREALGEPEVLAKLEEWWGREVFGADGRPDRAQIAGRVFTNPVERGNLESLLYPLIATRRAAIISAAELNPAVKAIILDSPLLFESRLDRECDAVVFIEASEPERLGRLQETRNWDLNELRRREQWQLPIEEKKSRSTHVLPNHGSISELRSNIAEILRQILVRKSAGA